MDHIILAPLHKTQKTTHNCKKIKIMMQKKGRFSAFLTVFILVLVVFSGCETASKTRVIKLGHGLDVSHPVHKAMVFMRERLEGKIKRNPYH